VIHHLCFWGDDFIQGTAADRNRSLLTPRQNYYSKPVKPRPDHPIAWPQPPKKKGWAWEADISMEIKGGV
jgi:hypothetical protein